MKKSCIPNEITQSRSEQRLMMEVVLLVHNNFKNDSRVLKEAKSLQKGGYRVQVVALHEDGQPEREFVQSIPVHYIRLKTRGWSKKKLVQLIKYAELIYRTIKYYRQVDILHCNDLQTLPIGVLIKTFFNTNVKIVYDAHEYETEVQELHGLEKRLVKWLERKLITNVDAVLTVSNSIADEYVRLYGISKPTLVLNCPPYQRVQKKNIFRDRFGIGKEQTIFLYQGGLLAGRGIEILLEVFRAFTDDKVLVLMGFGPLEKLVKEYASICPTIFFHEVVKSDVLLNYTASADFGILFYENNCLNHYYCSPNKMFEYIMAGIPVIVPNLYEMRRIVTENGVGIVASEYSREGLRTAVKAAMMMDRSDLTAHIDKLKNHYNWEEQEKLLLDTYKKIE